MSYSDDFGSDNLVINQLVDNFPYSCHLSAWIHIDAVRRNSVSVTHGGLKVNW